MKYLITILLVGWASGVFAQDRLTNTVILDEVAEANLGIETVAADEGGFEELIFALGEVRHTCSSHSVVSSRIAGRVIEVLEFEGHTVKKGDVVAKIESLQPSDPPPVIDLIAPAPGLIVDSKVHLGAPVEPSIELMEILDLSSVWVVAKVSQQNASVLSEGTLARIVVPAHGKQAIEATFMDFGTQADPVSGSIEAIFVVDNSDGKLRPGMRAELSIVAGKRDGVLVVPRDSVQGQGGDRYVFIRDYELAHSFVKAPVKTGEANDDKVEIVSGLFPGDEVVTRGAYSLAFSGGGGTSLKEALDAAHGHPHNEDGTEMTKEQIAAADSGGDGHGHAHQAEHNHSMVTFLAIACGVLLLLLIASPFFFRAKTQNS